MQVGDKIELTIEKLNSEGDGLARYEGFVFFVKNSCPEDVLECRITKLNKSYGYAEILNVITPSQYRVVPVCKFHKICGACNLQHISYEAQLKYKKQALIETLNLPEKYLSLVKDIMTVGDGFTYRAKVQYPVGSKNNSSRILAGYYKKSSHELVNIKYCPIQPRIIDELVEFIKTAAENCQIPAYSEKKHSGILRHIVVRYSEYNHKMLVLLVVNSNEIMQSLRRLAHQIFEAFEDVVGVSINFNTKRSNVILGDRSESIVGQDYIEEKLCDVVFKISGDTFFQVNPKCANLMFGFIKDYIKSRFERPVVFDAYAGIAAFGIVLSDVAKDVISVEINEQSIKKASENIASMNIENIKVFAKDTMKFLEDFEGNFDVTIIDPPRKGSDIVSLKKIAEITDKMLVYVSCNPATLARDLKFLFELGFVPELIQPFDMFPQTGHVETVVFLSR